MQLTETQTRIISAYQAEIKAIEHQLSIARQKYDAALFLIAGKEFKNYEIREGELIIKDPINAHQQSATNSQQLTTNS
jgi:hypothetical protein